MSNQNQNIKLIRKSQASCFLEKAKCLDEATLLKIAAGLILIIADKSSTSGVC